MIVYVHTANKGTLNLRVAPRGAILLQIPNGTKLDAESQGEWSKVTYKGKTGYVKTEFLSISGDKTVTKEDLRAVYNSLRDTLVLIEKILE